MEAYYYSQMNKSQQQVYHAMKVGLTALDASFIVPRLDGKELQDIFFKLRLDCPEIFYAVEFRYRYDRDASNVEVIPVYLFNKKKVQEHQKALSARMSKLLRPTVALTEWEKELYIHDFICTNVRYDQLKKPYSHEIIGPLSQGVGVCEGIAKTVKALCDALGIWCIIVISDANPQKQIKYRHAWNFVKIEGEYYHLDATFDNTLSHAGRIRYDYFNRDDQSIFADHELVMDQVPQCNDDNHFYYRIKKLSFTKMEDVAKRTLQSIRKGTPLIFHWRGGHITRQWLAKVLLLLEQTASKKGQHARVSLNWSQAVLEVIFSEKIPDQGLVIEDANEGEMEPISNDKQ